MISLLFRGGLFLFFLVANCERMKLFFGEFILNVDQFEIVKNIVSRDLKFSSISSDASIGRKQNQLHSS